MACCFAFLIFNVKLELKCQPLGLYFSCYSKVPGAGISGGLSMGWPWSRQEE